MIQVGPPMGRASTPGKRNPVGGVRQVQGSWEVRNLCFVRQLLEQRPGLPIRLLGLGYQELTTLQGSK